MDERQEETEVLDSKSHDQLTLNVSLTPAASFGNVFGTNNQYTVPEPVSFSLEVDRADLALMVNCDDEDLFDTMAQRICVNYGEYLLVCTDLLRQQPSIKNLWRLLNTIRNSSPVLTHGFAARSAPEVDGIFSYYENWINKKGVDPKQMSVVQYSKWNICKTVFPFILLTPRARVEVGNVFDRYQKKYVVEEWFMYPSIRSFVSFFFDYLRVVRSKKTCSSIVVLNREHGPEQVSNSVMVIGGNHRLRAFRELIDERMNSEI